jgi:parallel beta-helix repeat protein
VGYFEKNMFRTFLSSFPPSNQFIPFLEIVVYVLFNPFLGIVVYDKGMGYFEKNIVLHNVGGIEVRRMGKPTLIGNVLVDNEIGKKRKEKERRKAGKRGKRQGTV